MKDNVRQIDVLHFVDGEKKLSYSGWFHCWSQEETAVGEISSRRTLAVVETPNGNIVLKDPDLIKFIDRPVT